MATSNSKMMGYAKDALVILVIPLIGWGVSLQVKNAVQDTQIVQLEKRLTEASKIGDKVAANTLAVGKLEVKIDGSRSDLKEIKTLLRQPAHP